MMHNIPKDQITNEHSVYVFLQHKSICKLIQQTDNTYQWIDIFEKTLKEKVFFQTIQQAIEDVEKIPDIEIHAFLSTTEAKNFIKSKL